VDVAALLTNSAGCGRRSRVVLTPRRWRQVDGGNSIGDGDNKARSPGRARNKPLKPLRAGMPGDPGVSVVTNARVYYTTRAAAGARAPGIPHALIGRKFQHNSGASRREKAKACLKISTPSSFRGDAKHRTRNLEIPGLVLTHHPGMTESGLLRCARNDGAMNLGYTFTSQQAHPRRRAHRLAK
jgi:hypothetical protein